MILEVFSKLSDSVSLNKILNKNLPFKGSVIFVCFCGKMNTMGEAKLILGGGKQ